MKTPLAGLPLASLLFSAMAVMPLLAAAPTLAAADVVTEWNEIAGATAAAGNHGASDASRTTALVHAAIFDAVNAVEPRHVAYRVKITAPAGASAEAAAVAAAHTALVRLYPEQKDRP